jgi:hypothetical protein
MPKMFYKIDPLVPIRKTITIKILGDFILNIFNFLEILKERK